MPPATKKFRNLLTGALVLASAAVLVFLSRGRAPAAQAPRPVAQAVSSARAPLAGEAPPAQRAPALAPAPAAPASGAGETVPVEVVRAGTREPLPGARVWCWSRAPALASDGDFDDWLRHGRVEEHLPSAFETRADERGRAQVPEHAQGFVLAAEAAGLWGCASFTQLHEPPAVVALEPDGELRVQVVDAAGQPVAGVPVALRQRRGPALFEHLLARSEGPQAIALLRHAGHFLRALPGLEDEFAVGVQALCEPPIERRLEPGALPSEPIRLELRPSGACRVVLVDGQGASVGGAFVARLSFADASAPAARRGESRRSRGSGEVLFEQVDLGHTLLAEVEREGHGPPLELRGAGPQRPGEQVLLRIPVERDSAILRGRVLEVAGQPAGERELRARLDREEWRLWSAADGRFALQTAPRELPADARLALAALGPDGAELAVAELALPPELSAGSFELGDCALRELPQAAAGVVVDEAGQPIAGALVHAWLAERALPSALTDASGAFAIRAEAAGGELGLSAEKAGLSGDPLRATAPATGLRLVLGRSGAIEGRVRLDPSLAQSLVLVVAERETSAVSAALGADGSFVLAGLHPGNWSVRVLHAASASTLASVAGVRVAAGASARDPRLDPLDLCGGARVLELEPTDEQGRPVPQARAFSRPSGDAESRWIAAEPAGARLRILGDGRPLDVSIAAEGFFRSELTGLRASRRVVLQRGAQLRLELAGGVQLPEAPLFVGVELTPLEAGPGGFAGSRQAFFGPDGVLACESSSAGALRARIVVARRGQGNAQLVHAGDAIPSTLQVAAQSSLQVFSIRVDPAALAAAIEAARSGD